MTQQYKVIAFKNDSCVRHVSDGDQAIVEDLLWKGYVVYRPDTDQVATAIVQGCVGWTDAFNSPMAYQHVEKNKK